MYIQQEDSETSWPQKCQIYPIIDLFSDANSFHSSVELKFDFSCDFEEMKSEEGIIWIIYQGEDLKPIGSRQISLKADLNN